MLIADSDEKVKFLMPLKNRFWMNQFVTLPKTIWAFPVFIGRLVFVVKLIYKEHTIVDELRKKERRTKSLQLKEQGA